MRFQGSGEKEKKNQKNFYSLFIKNILTKFLAEYNLVASFIYYLKVLHGTRWNPFPEVLRLKWKISSQSTREPFFFCCVPVC